MAFVSAEKASEIYITLHWSPESLMNVRMIPNATGSSQDMSINTT